MTLWFYWYRHALVYIVIAGKRESDYVFVFQLKKTKEEKKGYQMIKLKKKLLVCLLILESLKKQAILVGH